MGGPSSEHEVSLKTGEMVLKNLNPQKFESFPVKIGKDGSWPITLWELKKKIDAVFVALHGEYGEDGQLQTILETFKIPYTGSDPVASALAMDKQATASFLSKSGLTIPTLILVSKDDSYAEWAIQKNFSAPLVVKPNNLGSSVGVSMVKNPSGLKEALRLAFQHSSSVLAQKYIAGQELTCGVLEINGVPIPLVPTEIIPNQSEFFDYYAKYNVKGSREITPPDLPAKLIKKIQMTALKVHKLLGCSGMSRTDMILGKDGNLHILELNTIPGMTETSLLPQQAAAMGINFPQLLEIIINSALQKNGK